MPSGEILSFILQGAIALGVALVGMGVRGIYSQLRQLNGRVTTLMVWRDAHEKLDDERHKKSEKNLENLWRKIDSQ